MNTSDIGTDYEITAACFLKNLGYKIITCNYKVLPIGEIDIIAQDGQTTVFVEVKFRKNDKYGKPYEFVNKSKQIKIIKTALCYLKQNKIKKDIRFDIVSVCGNEIEHIKNAFCADNGSYYF